MARAFNYHRSAIDMAMELNEGNPGALFVCRQILQALPEAAAKNLFTVMADMNVRGQLIHIAFGCCEKDLGRFMKSFLWRDHALVECVNRTCEQEGLSERAVTKGAIEWPAELS